MGVVLVVGGGKIGGVDAVESVGVHSTTVTLLGDGLGKRFDEARSVGADDSEYELDVHVAFLILCFPVLGGEQTVTQPTFTWLD